MAQLVSSLRDHEHNGIDGSMSLKVETLEAMFKQKIRLEGERAKQTAAALIKINNKLFRVAFSVQL